MDDDEIIAALNLPATLPQLTPPRAPATQKDTTQEGESHE